MSIQFHLELLRGNWHVPAKLFLLLILGTGLNTLGFAQRQSPFHRRYQSNEISVHSLKTSTRHNGVDQGTTFVRSSLKTQKNKSGVFFEEVSWLSKYSVQKNDTVHDDKTAQSVKPFTMSVAQTGMLEIPLIDVADMTGAITDLITFYVAISPNINIWSLQNPGDSISSPQPVKGNFANGKTIIIGDDCLQISAKFISAGQDEIILKTYFMPPRDSCLRFVKERMSAPVIPNGQNNFQMIRPAGNKNNVFYGSEYFVITTRLRKSDGKIIHAEMYNKLELKLDLQCDANYEQCSTTIPLVIERRLDLQLLSETLSK